MYLIFGKIRSNAFEKKHISFSININYILAWKYTISFFERKTAASVILSIALLFESNLFAVKTLVSEAV
jgi:hypothetical protein